MGTGSGTKKQKSMDLDNSKIISTVKSYCTKEGGKNGLQDQESETFLWRRQFFIITRVVEEQLNPRLEQQNIGNFF
jgi:hypothetical protein